MSAQRFSSVPVSTLVDAVLDTLAARGVLPVDQVVVLGAALAVVTVTHMPAASDGEAVTQLLELVQSMRRAAAMGAH
jgi:hypothetical protein